jgi:hypothetical protein
MVHTKIIQPPIWQTIRSNMLWLSAGLATVLLAVGWWLLPLPASAASQSYLTTDKSITKGYAVAVVSGSSQQGQQQTFVQKSSVSRAQQTLGVVVDLGDSLVTSVDKTSQLYVADSGQAEVYVTDLNGTVKKGDLLAPSPLEGVLMRADNGTPGILGVALANFDGQSAQTVKVASGSISSAKVELLAINMDVRFATSSPGVQESFLERLGQSIVHRQVNQLQAFVALAILILLIVVDGSIAYAAINSSILSIGRNPLAKRTVFRGLLQASGLVLMVLLAGLAAIYMVLRA